MQFGRYCFTIIRSRDLVILFCKKIRHPGARILDQDRVNLAILVKMEQLTIHSTFGNIFNMAVQWDGKIKTGTLSTALNKAGKVVGSIFQKNLDRLPWILQLTRMTSNYKRILDRDHDLWYHDATIVEKIGQKCRLHRRYFSIRMPAFGTVDHNFWVYEQLYPSVISST